MLLGSWLQNLATHDLQSCQIPCSNMIHTECFGPYPTQWNKLEYSVTWIALYHTAGFLREVPFLWNLWIRYSIVNISVIFLSNVLFTFQLDHSQIFTIVNITFEANSFLFTKFWTYNVYPLYGNRYMWLFLFNFL